jgi:hypothetical protein
MNMSYWCVFNRDISKSQMKRFFIASNRYGGRTAICDMFQYPILIPTTMSYHLRLSQDCLPGIRCTTYCSVQVRSAISSESPPNLSSS